MGDPSAIGPTPRISSMEKPDAYCSAIAEILSVPQFNNESDVREDFLLPLLKALGYANSGKHKIERNIRLHVPQLIIGTKKKSMETYSPDYVLNVNGMRKWLIDAKSSTESVLDMRHISQAYSYAIHKEVNVPFFSLCNGEELALFKTADQNYQPIATFKRYELDYRWQEVYEMLSVDAFKVRLQLISNPSAPVPSSSDRSKSPKWDVPIQKVIIPRKQASPIHAGTHPYFTKRAWNVVRQYIEHFTDKDDVVLDPFGGAGVTTIESVLVGRKAVHMDINPIANFMTEALLVPVPLDQFGRTFEKLLSRIKLVIRDIYSQSNPKPQHWYPKDVRLPKDADVEFVHEYFSPHQLSSMAFLLHEIRRIGNSDLQKVFLLIFSSTLVKCNVSYHNTGRDPKAGGGDAGFLKYYRYQIPRHRFPEQDPVVVFTKKYEAMFKAKREISRFIQDPQWVRKRINIIQGSATSLDGIADESIDYIFTDPPYGSKIAYLDCSILWNAWLQLSVTNKEYEQEVISGGFMNKSDEDFITLLQQSLTEIHRVLKSDRWFSIVFASENPKFWHAVRDYCIKTGFEHVNTVCQPSDRKTVKKNQNPLTVFRGELILNFRKRKSGRNIVGIKSALPPRQYVLNSAELTIVAEGGKASIEDIMQDLLPKLWESGLLGAVSNEIEDVTELLKDSFEYDRKNGVWKIPHKTKIGSHIPLESRIKFYLLSCLNRAKLEKRMVTIDDIVMEVLPFLRNGITPKNQDIITELKKVAYSRDEMHWELLPSLQSEFSF
ncbi:MAG: type I restriction enzyme HsdR N-terminal domain-containing protein [Nitrospira sp.]|nr:type I restriction enzyme HsdR N-terminal domain-containing protein [Nitrospira sp.]